MSPISASYFIEETPSSGMPGEGAFRLRGPRSGRRMGLHGYSRRYVSEIHDYHSGLFAKMIAAGTLADEDPVVLAMMYDAPILVMLGECDRHPEREAEYMEKLEEHVRLFYKTFHRNSKEE